MMQSVQVLGLAALIRVQGCEIGCPGPSGQPYCPKHIFAQGVLILSLTFQKLALVELHVQSKCL